MFSLPENGDEFERRRVAMNRLDVFQGQQGVRLAEERRRFRRSLTGRGLADVLAVGQPCLAGAEIVEDCKGRLGEAMKIVGRTVFYAAGQMGTAEAGRQPDGASGKAFGAGQGVEGRQLDNAVGAAVQCPGRPGPFIE